LTPVRDQRNLIASTGVNTMLSTILIDASLCLSMLAVFIALPSRKPALVAVKARHDARIGDTVTRAPGIR
jgi:hypothetical protein